MKRASKESSLMRRPSTRRYTAALEDARRRGHRSCRAGSLAPCGGVVRLHPRSRTSSPHVPKTHESTPYVIFLLGAAHHRLRVEAPRLVFPGRGVFLF